MRWLVACGLLGVIIGGAVAFAVLGSELEHRPTRADLAEVRDRAAHARAEARAEAAAATAQAAWTAAVAEKHAQEARYVAALLAKQIEASGGTPVATLPPATPAAPSTPTSSPCQTVTVKGKCIDPPGLGG